MARHLDFLGAHAESIQAAGPLTDPEANGRDGLWIVEADTAEEADRLVHVVPF
ncbi:MAG: hypothetical protein QNJ20_15340 [Paracoccaceae bacterium]|nr:hypothetical protein [Paracoccaceae bacterium]